MKSILTRIILTGLDFWKFYRKLRVEVEYYFRAPVKYSPTKSELAHDLL